MPRKQALFELDNECPSETLAPIIIKIASTFASTLARETPICHDSFLAQEHEDDDDNFDI